MKKLFFCLLFTALLAGCAREETMETLGDVWDVPAMAVPRQILVDLPDKKERIDYLHMVLGKLKNSEITENQIESIASRAVGASPADLESIVRSAA